MHNSQIYIIFAVHLKTFGMKIFEFERNFPSEESGQDKFREMRMKEGVVCPQVRLRASLLEIR